SRESPHPVRADAGRVAAGTSRIVCGGERDGHHLTVPTISNPVEEQPPTWVSISAGARYAGVSRAAIEREVQKGRVRAKREGRTQLVALESLLAVTTPQDIVKLRATIERAMRLESAPDP